LIDKTLDIVLPPPPSVNCNGVEITVEQNERRCFKPGAGKTESFKVCLGLYQVHGNVHEWTEDCWNVTNEGNPGDGRARTTRQLPDLSTIIRVESSSSDDSRRQRALPLSAVSRCSRRMLDAPSCQ
jgi:formylglycine-generating enzyme required for sulfatase activity